MSDDSRERSVIDASARFGSSSKASPGGVGSGGGGPHDPIMDARVARLEEDFKEFRHELRSVRSELSSLRVDMSKEFASVRKDLSGEVGILRVDVAELKGMARNLPSTWVMLTAMFGFAIAVSGLVFAIARAISLAVPKG